MRTAYATSRLIADEAVSSGADIGRAWLASGSNYPDAPAAGPAAAAELGVLMLIDGGSQYGIGLSWAAQCVEACVDPDRPGAGIIWEGEPSDSFVFDPEIEDAGRHLRAGTYRYNFIYRW